MEELSECLEQIINRGKNYESKWENEVQEMKLKLEAILLGTSATVPRAAVGAAASPQQKKKRAKRLSSIADNDDESAGLREIPSFSGNHLSKTIESSIVINETVPAEEVESQQLPEPTPETEPEHVFVRPMRAAKLKTENCLKEPSINSKLRRPDTASETRKIKKENEQRQSQVTVNKLTKANKSQSEGEEPQTPSANESVASTKRVDESVVVVADKDAPVVEISEEEDSSSMSSVVEKKKSKKDPLEGKNAVVKIKKEMLSLSGFEEIDKSPPIVAPAVVPTVTIPLKHEASSSNVEETLQTTTTSTANTTETTRGKRGKKKKEFAHRPIKEERISIEAVVPSPVSTRTRSGSISKPRADSVYEDAVDNIPQGSVEEKTYSTPPQTSSAVPVAGNICNETVATSNATMVTAFDATFVANQANNTFAVPAAQTTFVMQNNPDATVTIANDVFKKPNGSLGDATFDVKDPPLNDSIMTEDDSFEKPLTKLKQNKQLKQLPPPPPPATAKVPKSKGKANELFNPCVQSPVKKKVEAFERLQTRSKRAKENSEPELPSIRDLKSGSVTTPIIGKPHAPVLGRFLTPTQQSNLALSSAVAKKLPNSASKIMPFPTSKQSSASNLKCSSSSSSQSLSRENSEEDPRKGFNKLQQLAEERKKKREIKHQQAAAIREAKEKERADRLKKIAKEREEKNRKKVAEMEQKKRELEEINRNLKLQEERELKQATSSKTKLDAAEAARQERELLEQMKQPKMKMPPPPKLHNKYNFNMLHSDDSTDDEGKTSYKRPPPPLWSKSSVRIDCITMQTYLSSDIIDSFFSVQPMTPDLKAIFPNIDSRHLKRNSSAIWQTPPRYSEMPKY